MKTNGDIPVCGKQFCHYCGGPLIRKHWEGRSRLFCPRCHEAIYENPVPATAVVVPANNGTLLLVKRNVAPKKGYWSLAGGFMELNETPESAALRELEEETGLRGDIETLLGVAAHDSPTYGTVLIVGYLAANWDGEIGPGDDASDVAFFSPDALPEIAFDTHRRFIRKALRYLKEGSPAYHCRRTDTPRS